MKKITMILTLVLSIILLSSCQDNKSTIPELNNVNYENFVITWDKIDAVYYELVINKKVYKTEDTSFDVSFLETGSYQVNLVAIVGLSRSNPAEFYISVERPFPTNLTIIDNTLSFEASSFSNATEIYIDDTMVQTITTSTVDLTGLGLEINQTYQVQLISLYLNDFKSNLSDTINYYYYEIGHPYLKSPASINYQYDPLVFEFHLGEATFVSINAGHNDNMDTNDYVLADSTLTIQESFITRLLDNNPDRQVIILTYQLKFETKFIIGYLFIHLT